MNTSTKASDNEHLDALVGTVSYKFNASTSYKAAASKNENELLFPGGLCIFFELQIDPVSLMHVNHSGFSNYLA